MKILAIEKEVRKTDWSSVSTALLAEEALAIYRMYTSQRLQEHYFNEEKCAILILECQSIACAQELLQELPLVKHNLIAFDVMELRPYTGYNRILNLNNK